MAIDRNTRKRARRIAVALVVLVPVLYLAPRFALFFLVCGALDIRRHFKITPELAEKYFLGNGIPTWLLSPINLLADLLSARNLGAYRLEDLPAAHRAEIEACVKAFVDNGEVIKARVAEVLGDRKRGMLTFKWFARPQDITMRIPAFERDYRYIKTIAVSVFNVREKTSWHFGPLRLTFRVLYNLDPIDSDGVFINVDDKTHYWKDQPLFVFDDTLFHQSVNDADQTRYCLFMDIVRPNHLQPAFDAAIAAAAMIASSFKTVFYKNWSFIR
ncbi:aspartyl/asparaginyl beta-hydroxylase domain-containing protein [Bradyrhizobium erythrophlei]|uniref:aspartyl/asparaginyl beta-hydroxylase domain-containing protein n=1 Tax=Bradyrhizobium erythrophlei TaxID=1437360 RepID=UPI0035E676CE